jgi:hypothetical protein
MVASLLRREVPVVPTQAVSKAVANDEKIKSLAERFVFDDNQTHPIVILVSGKEGAGKTHLAMSMSESGPVYLIDTEYRAHIIKPKFPQDRVFVKIVKNYKQLYASVLAIVKKYPPGTIVIDTGSDIQTFAEIEYLDIVGRDQVGMPYNWAEIWRMCNAILDTAKFAGFSLIITSRMKDEYIANNPTGRQIPSVYKAIPYKADIMLNYDKETREWIATKTSYTHDINIPIPKRISASLPSIQKYLEDYASSSVQEVIPSISKREPNGR